MWRLWLSIGVAVLAGASGLIWPPGLAAQSPPRHSPLYPPGDLGLLEPPDRDLWQRPEQIMDVLRIADGSTVADLGAGAGWLTVRLARRVGPRGLVYAEDVQPEMITAIRRRVGRERLTNVRTVLGSESDPMLPSGRFDAVVLLDLLPEVEDRTGYLRKVATLLKKPKGLIGIIEYRNDGLGPGPPLSVRVARDDVLRSAQAAGMRLVRSEEFLPFQYFLVFGQ